MIYIEVDNRRRDNLIFCSVIFVYALLIIVLAKEINISEDEMYTLNTTSRNLRGVIRQSYFFEGQPPGYFVLLSFWRKINNGIFFSRLFSVVSIGVSAFYFYWLVTSLFGKSYSKWILLIFLFNPFTIWAALEIRTYAFLILLSSMSLYYFYEYYKFNRTAHLLSFLIIALIGVYTQYFFWFLLGALACLTVILKGWKFFLRFCLYLLPVLILFLPNFHYILSQISLHEVDNNRLSKYDYTHSIAYSPQNFLLGTTYLNSIWTNRIIRIIFFFVFAIAYFKYYFSKDKSKLEELKKINILLTAIISMLILFYSAFVITEVTFNVKYLAVVFPIFILLFSLFKIYKSSIPILLYLFTISYYLVILIPFYYHPVKTYDYRSAAKFIKMSERLNEPIIVYRPALAMPLSEYYTGSNRIVPIPHPVNFDSSYLINIKDTSQLQNIFASINNDVKSYLFVSDTTLFEGALNMNRTMITNYLNTNYKITLDSLFYGNGKEKPLRIRRIEKIEKFF